MNFPLWNQVIYILNQLVQQSRESIDHSAVRWVTETLSLQVVLN